MWPAPGAYGVVPENDLPGIAAELKTFADSLSEDTLANTTKLSESILAYLEDHGPEYFGSTVTVLVDGKAAYSPYVYWDDDQLVQSDDLMAPSYNIDEQAWLREPIDQGKAVWTEPYFDEGGGGIWMRTRSYPIISSDGEVSAVATTDVRVSTPPDSSGSYDMTRQRVFNGYHMSLLGISGIAMFCLL